MTTLYECLREARLDHFYPAFRANGITRSETLITLGMAEFCALGITTAEDKRRLVELINIVKSVHRTSHASSPTVQRQTNRFRPSINASPSSALIDGSQTPVRGSNQTKSRNISNNRSSNYLGISNTPVRLEPSRNVVVQDRIPNFSVSSYMDMLQYMSDESESSGEESDVAKPFVPVANRKTSSPSLGRSSVSKWPNVERVKHYKSKGYNYGVHKINTPTKSKAKSGAQRHTADEKIKVCVRKRPLTKRELKAREEDIVNVESTNTLAVNEPKLAVDLKAYTLQHEFMFDEVFDETCTNEDVYIRAARPLINCVFNGGTATCFAYGQTGAGKTHTMLGNVNTPGLYLLAGQDIFNIIQSEKYGKDLHVWVSFFEIYCGQLFDLLNKRNRLHAREDGSHQVCIAGLTETEATSVTSLVQILEYGNSVRSKGATGVNPDSSRSHAILQLDIRNGEDIKIGKISFIDLAGSERASDVTDTDKQTRMEGAEINQSLLALKECIRSIDQESRHTPFRQSKLTHILKDSFVGNSRTCMIANISPTQSSCENTINTLRYADRVKELKREGVRSSSVGQAMNLLMNIPPTAPSVFHPSNILSTSTPQRQTTHSRRDRMTDIVIDPSETPIRGHNMPRWTPVKDGSKNRNVTSPSPNTMSRHEKSTSSVPVVPPGSSARFSTHATAASQGALAPPPDASPSESDVTDTDSCNVTHPINNKYSSSNRPVAKSSDTEYEFPTSDFNDLNDLNRTGENQAILSQPPPATEDQAVSAASASMETVISGIIRAPAVKPVVYKSMDPGAEIVAENSTNSPGYFPLASNVSQNFTPFLTKAAKLTELEEAEKDYKKSLIQELMRSSDDSIDDEVLLAEDTNSEIPELQNQNVASITPTVGIRNNNVMIPLPAESSDLTKFTQRIPFKAFEMKPTGLNDLTSKPISLIPQQQDIPLPSTPISLTNHNRPGSAQSKSAAPNTGSTAIDATNIFTQQEQIPVRQLPRPKTKTPNSEPNIIPPYPVQQISKSPQMTTVDYDMDQSPRLQHHSDPSEFRFRSTISQSPTGEHSDDSTDSIRQSFSDQGQGGYRHFKDREVVNMRKEKSDPMLALDMQRKKQTLPDPQKFSKILTRSNTPKSVRTNKEASLKVSHNDIVSMKPSLVEKQESNENNKGGQSSHISPRPEQTIDLEKDNLKKQVEDTRPKGKQLPQVPFLRQDVPSKSNSVIVTEKLMAGAVFSPIHPQPVTNMEKKLHADSITTPSANVQGSPAPSTENTAANSGGEHSQALQDESRIRLITSHEDQLATVTQLCKNEMRLLLNAKKISGKRGFDEYVRRVDDILQQKMNVIASLHEEISLYITNNTQSHSVLSSVAVSTSSINSASSSHDSHLQFVSTNR